MKRYRADLDKDELSKLHKIIYELPSVYADIKITILGPIHHENISSSNKLHIILESNSPINTLEEAFKHSPLSIHGFGEMFIEIKGD